MTTRVHLHCPDTSHWHVKVTIQDKVFDTVDQKMTDEWRTADRFVLKQTESRDVYVHSTRRLIIEEREPQ